MTPLRLPLFLVLVLAAGSRAGDADPKALVLIQTGKLPIILSAPHGGAKPIPDAAKRKGEGLEPGPAGFRTGRDTGTEELVQDVAARVEKQFGAKPYIVAARFARSYADANRPPEIAVEGPQARAVYDAYHAALVDACKAVQKAHGRGLLLDFHGQGTAADTIYRGTQNGKTVTLLTQRYGEAAQVGPKSFFGLLAAEGCKVFPEVESKAKEQAGFTGGFIVQTYGSHQGYGIDAVQLEFGSDYRGDADKRAAAADKVAAAIAGYAKLYLP